MRDARLRERRRGPLLACAALLAGALLPATALAQSWPNDAGPNQDILRFSVGQWERLAPPPVDAQRRNVSLPVIEPQTVPSVDVGTPVMALPAAPQPRLRGGRSVTRSSARRIRATTRAPRTGRTSGDALERSVAERERRLERMQRELDVDRQRLQERRGGAPGPGASAPGPAGGGFVINPAAATTATPR